ncbi:hypothetical protein UA08_07311 [Talaromyces atroroseus]|uniref:DUF1993 domain-containing protein n=1 Tax=Talaromyces atroroseus TaxID=1441469 RepID=A0A225AEW3_TALAT|nr:hypothetical protein UA08_07311 [Talaromyces atroroseus]OKL57623.1 hypothetical protein UA08_07311 [Talaromyces atroroseus]
MATPLYDASVPVFKNGLNVLKNILTKAIEHYGAKTTEEIIKATLIEDMLPLPAHVQVASNIAKASMVRVTGISSIESWPDNEDTVEKLIERCEKTIALLDTFTPDQLNSGTENRVRIDFRAGEMKGNSLDANAQEYLYSYGLPFFFFHLQVVYSILRMKGVPLGSADFLKPYVGRHLVPTASLS